MKKFLLVATVAGMFAVTGLVLADSSAIDFEAPAYVAGTINGQNGWSSLGAAGSGCATYDHAVGSSMSVAGFGAQSLRISNAVTSGCFGDQTFSSSLGDEAGETAAENGGSSGGTRQTHFEAQFDIASTKSVQQPGLFMSVSPDRGDGARMSYLGFDDQADGVHVIFYDYQDGAVEAAGTCSTGANFIPTDVATLDRTAPHTAKFSMDFVDGPNNDIVKIYVDGVLEHTGTSWEGYFNYCEGNPTRTVDSLLFRTGGTAAPATAGFGYLVDNMQMSSGPILVGPPTNKDQCKNGGWQSFNNPTFKNQGQCVAGVVSKSSKH